MNEEFNNINFEEDGIISEFKMNTLIFCTQKSLDQIQKNNKQITPSPQVNQALKNLSSIDETFYNQYVEKQEKGFKQNSVSQQNSQVEVNQSSTQSPQVESNELVYEDIENAKTPENQQNNRRISEQSEPFNSQLTTPSIIQKHSQDNILFIDTKQVQKQVQNVKANNTIHKSNSLDLSQMKYNNKIYTQQFDENQNNTFDNGYQNQFNSASHSQCDSPNDSLQGISRDQLNSKNNSQEDQNYFDFGESNQCNPQSAKKSKFHFEFNQQGASDSKNEGEYVFQSKEQELKHSMMVRQFQECQSFDQGQNRKDNVEKKDFSKSLFRSKSLYQQQQQLKSSKFSKVKNAIITIQRLSRNPTTQINSIIQLESDIKQYRARSFSKQSNQPKEEEDKGNNPFDSNYTIKTETDEQAKASYKKNYKEAFDGFRRREKLNLLCERGSEDDLIEIKQMIDSDPKKYLRGPKDPGHFLNSRNIKGQTPLYVSCKNGNLEVVKFLIAAQCDFMLTSKIQKNLEETPLETALRWNHVEICNHMLEKCNFEDKYLIKCLPLCPNANLKKLVESKIKKKSTACQIF